jgi:hypothetical protein
MVIRNRLVHVASLVEMVSRTFARNSREGDAATTNLPPGCCDAVFLRDVYHHLTSVESFNSACARHSNRKGDSPSEEGVAMGFTHVRTISLACT